MTRSMQTKKKNTELFQYVKPNNNDMFSLMSGADLQDLLYYLDNYYLELRNSLGFSNNITFGLEIECEDTYRSVIEEKLKKASLISTWPVKDEYSFDDNIFLNASLRQGLEISSPILTDTITNWNDLKTVCKIASECAVIGPYSGGPIHVGTQVLGSNTTSWLNFMKIWSVYENVIYRFAFGEFLSARSYMHTYAPPISKGLWQDYQKLKELTTLELPDIIKKIAHDRYQAVNFKNVIDFNSIKDKNTIEFRCPNGTLNPIIWQNNVNLFVHLLLYAKDENFNDDIIDKRKQENGDKYLNLELYGEIYLQQALEFCDMVFTNNFDKVYFLRQYLKSFQADTNLMTRSKEFTRLLKK